MKTYIIAVWEREIGRLHDEFEKAHESPGVFFTPIDDWNTAGVGVTGGTAKPTSKREVINAKLAVARVQLKMAQDA